MSKSKTPKAELQRSIKNTEYQNVEIKHVGFGAFEIWRGSPLYERYICLVTKVKDKWGATHNMHPNENTEMFDSAVTAIRNYDRIRKD